MMNNNQMANSSSTWTWEQDKAFEIALINNLMDFEDKWDLITAQIPGNKTIEEVQQHYRDLVADVMSIDSGTVSLPNYGKPKPMDKAHCNCICICNGNGCGGSRDTAKAKATANPSNAIVIANANTRAYIPPTNDLAILQDENELEWEKRKGKLWTEEEHILFLMGMASYGKGDWKGIAQDFVKTRNATQVASHAQKHFSRQAKRLTKDTRRWSIFDITCLNQERGGSSSSGDSSNADAALDNAIIANNNNIDSNENDDIDEDLGMLFVRSNEAGGQAEDRIPPFADKMDQYRSPPQSWCIHDDDIDSFIDDCLALLPPL